MDFVLLVNPSQNNWIRNHLGYPCYGPLEQILIPFPYLEQLLILLLIECTNVRPQSCWLSWREVFVQKNIVLAPPKYKFLRDGFQPIIGLSLQRKKEQSQFNCITWNTINFYCSTNFKKRSNVLMRVFSARHHLKAISHAIWIKPNFNLKLFTVIGANYPVLGCGQNRLKIFLNCLLKGLLYHLFRFDFDFLKIFPKISFDF